MKIKQLLVMALLFCGGASTVSAQQNAVKRPKVVTIKGTIDGIKSGKLLLIAQTGEQKMDTLGTANFQFSDFVLRGILKEPMVAQVVVDGYQGGFLLMAEPGATYQAKLTNDQTAYIKGGALQDDYQNHMRYSDSLRAQIMGLRERYKTLRESNKFRSASRTNDTLKTQEALWKTSTEEFLGRHDDLISAYTFLMNAMMRQAGAEQSQALYDQMGPGAKETVSARILKERIARLQQTASGAIAPDFTLNDLEGNPITMSKVKGKIKIVDFWASWCGPCRLNNPSLKKLYADFHDKGLEIIGVSLDSNKARWADGVAKQGLPWIQVSSLKGWKCETARLYNVTGIPALFVLDENNHIIATGLKGDALRKFVQEKLTEK